jgi:hypothetical protein
VLWARILYRLVGQDPPVFTYVDPRSTPVGHGNLLHEIRPNDWDCQVAAEAELRHAVVDYLAGKSLSHKIS